MSNILNTEFDTNEEDPSFEPAVETSQDNLENKSQDETKEESVDMDQIPIGKICFTLDNAEGEALVYPSEDVKVTTINEMECADTLDEDDCNYDPEKPKTEEEPSQEDEDKDLENEDVEKEEECEDFEVVKQTGGQDKDGNDLQKLKFKDVEEWKKENSPVEVESQECEELEEEQMAEKKKTEDCEYNEEDDKDYNPIYNNDTLSDVEEPEDENDDDLKEPEVVHTADDFCMLKVPQEVVSEPVCVVENSREEMECC